MKIHQQLIAIVLIIATGALLSACGQSTDATGADDASDSAATSEAFVKADPPVGAVLDRHPRTLRVYLTGTPDVANSTVKLFGDQGEISLSHFHTMGMDDLMIEIDDHPLPNGEYRVEWMATIGEDAQQHSGSYEFTVAVED